MMIGDKISQVIGVEVFIFPTKDKILGYINKIETVGSSNSSLVFRLGNESFFPK